MTFQFADCSDSVHLGTDGGGSVCQTSFARHGFSHACYLALFPKCLDYTRIVLYLSKSHGSYESYPIDTWYIFTFFFKLPYTRPFSHYIRCFRVATQKCQDSSADRFHGWPWVGVCLLPGQCVLAAEVSWAVFTVGNSWENRIQDLWDPMNLQESCFLVMIWRYDFWEKGYSVLCEAHLALKSTSARRLEFHKMSRSHRLRRHTISINALLTSSQQLALLTFSQ